VELRVDANQAKYFRSLPLHPTQEERELEDGYFMFTYRLVPTFDFTRELLSKGELIEVVSPHWLRKEIANELRNTLSMYDDVLEEVPYFSEEDEYMFFEEEEQ
jgi:predicted DNA-binding transcriptional regulator YafY